MCIRDRLYPSIVHPLHVSIAEGGKPYLVSEPGVHFSLSHSGDWAVCAIGDHPLGVDIEKCEPGRPDIASRFFHRDEAVSYTHLDVYKRQVSPCEPVDTMISWLRG